MENYCEISGVRLIDNQPVDEEILKTQQEITRIMSSPLCDLKDEDILSLSRNGIGLLLKTHTQILKKRPSLVKQAEAADMAVEFRLIAEHNLMCFMKLQEFIEQYNLNK